MVGGFRAGLGFGGLQKSNIGLQKNLKILADGSKILEISRALEHSKLASLVIFDTCQSLRRYVSNAAKHGKHVFIPTGASYDNGSGDSLKFSIFGKDSARALDSTKSPLSSGGTHSPPSAHTCAHTHTHTHSGASWHQLRDFVSSGHPASWLQLRGYSIGALCLHGQTAA